jgi:hypothetical protein
MGILWRERVLAKPPIVLIVLRRPVQGPLDQLALLEFAGDVRGRAVGPAEDLGLHVLLGQQLADRLGHRHHVQQARPRLELGVEHDRAVAVADGPVGGALQHLHHPRDAQQGPHDDAGHHQRHAGPAIGVVGQDDQGDAPHGHEDLHHVHAAIFPRSRGTRVAATA